MNFCLWKSHPSYQRNKWINKTIFWITFCDQVSRKTNTLALCMKTLGIKCSLLSSDSKGNESMASGPAVHSQLQPYCVWWYKLAHSTMVSFSLTISFFSSDHSAAFGRLTSLPACILFKSCVHYVCLPACHQLAHWCFYERSLLVNISKHRTHSLCSLAMLLETAIVTFSYIACWFVFLRFTYFHLNVFPVCIHVCHVYAWYS